MATRYSGDVTVRILWNDRTSQYDAHVSWPYNGKTRTKKVYVGRPPAAHNGVDAPASYDDAAHAAITFAADEDNDIESHVAVKPDGAGWHVTRTPTKRWGNMKLGLKSQKSDLDRRLRKLGIKR